MKFLAILLAILAIFAVSVEANVTTRKPIKIRPYMKGEVYSSGHEWRRSKEKGGIVVVRRPRSKRQAKKVVVAF
ncbi:hypothetical protein L5515_012518 [Caenorhabditis briggsae]|uniref:Uncharacterized protein n=1 Tax=Caenorhabditis briggsae TaxID=6238 RepID=A0AAE9EW59_CAEBR|nr:hypothetical protein L5515_012518 [Caenorhabditis briggsae]